MFVWDEDSLRRVVRKQRSLGEKVGPVQLLERKRA